MEINYEKINFYSILNELETRGKILSPRGFKIKELENFNYTLFPYQRFCSFNERRLNIKYIKEEFKWYLKGARHDISICEHAKMWSSLINTDGSINSNYGQYIFANNAFYRAASEIVNDKDTRRASIMILNDLHLALGFSGHTNDVPCTYSINFRIRDDKLNMTVRMRSCDAIYGMGNDAPCFSFIHEMMLEYLKDTYPNLLYGEYYHSCDSFHVYEKHFEMLKNIINKKEFTKVDCPKISGKKEVEFLIRHDFSNIPNEFEFAKWLNT